MSTHPSAEPQGAERRVHRRYTKTLPLSYEVEQGRDWRPGSGRLSTLDISAGGARISVPEDLDEGQYIRLLLRFEGRPMSTVGRIVWVSPQKVKGSTVAGVRFENLEPATQQELDALLSRA